MVMEIKSFKLGKIVATPNALEVLERNGRGAKEFLDRHSNKDWGDICAEDAALNDDAVIHYMRIMSAYKINKREKIWIITEWDRSVTTILLPEDY